MLRNQFSSNASNLVKIWYFLLMEMRSKMLRAARSWARCLWQLFLFSIHTTVLKIIFIVCFFFFADLVKVYAEDFFSESSARRIKYIKQIAKETFGAILHCPKEIHWIRSWCSDPPSLLYGHCSIRRLFVCIFQKFKIDSLNGIKNHAISIFTANYKCLGKKPLWDFRIDRRRFVEKNGSYIYYVNKI